MSRRCLDLAVWALVGVVAAAAALWAYPRVFPRFSGGWQVHGREAQRRAADACRRLGVATEEATIVVTLDTDDVLERRLQQLETSGKATGSRLAERLFFWDVEVFPPGAGAGEQTCFGAISPRGTILGAGCGKSAHEGGHAPDEAAARVASDALLRDLGHDPAAFEPPVARRLEQAGGATGLILRYRDREALLGPDLPYGLEVELAGERPVCLRPWREEPAAEELLDPLRRRWMLSQVRQWMPFLIVALVAAPFLRRYNRGTVEVERGLRLFFLLAGCGAGLVMLIAWGLNEDYDFGVSRRQAAWISGFQVLMLLVAPMALAAALAWAAGEARCRERWGGKLAAFAAAIEGRFGNATVARAALRGPAAGLALAALTLLALPALGRLGVEVWSFSALGSFFTSSWSGLAMLAFVLVYGTFAAVFFLVFLLPPAVERWGRWRGGGAVTAIAALLFFPPLMTLPPGSDLLLAFPVAAVLVGLFLAYDLLTALLAWLTLRLSLTALPQLLAEDPFLRFQGVLPLALLALPLLLALPGLARGEEAVYRWRQVPAHVRRIAGRERQRLELETARKIQSSILPSLPSRLDGVELAHAYLPATEVGGDFYEAEELPDGRLVLAVGDVAGHGVGSGLVMALARSALAAQVALDPAVEEVFATLNRVLCDTARKSLMTTLCYGILDPLRRRWVFASAGHLFPYVVAAGGEVRCLESVAYPLGVRDELEIRPRRVELEPGDTLLLCSDGPIEAHSDAWDEPFGFERFEECLRRCGGGGPEPLCRGLLAEVRRYTGDGPRRDDWTLLAARISFQSP